MPRKIDPATIGTSVVNSGVGFGGMSVTINQYNQQQDSFPASSISVENTTNIYLNDNVESNLAELAGLIVERPPVLGETAKTFTYEQLTATHTGLPDWGQLRLSDSYIWERANPWTSHTGATVTAILGMGDSYGNTLALPLPDEVPEPIYYDAVGATFRGNYLSGDATISLVRTFNGTSATIYGMVYPADRGVLALVHWGLDGNLSEASSVSDIENRVLAAIKLGYGIETDGENNDGEPGGIFTEGTGDVFPSRKSGQYDLTELLTGLHRITGATIFDANARAGQVRLLTKPEACYFGEDVATTTANGIPILGGDDNAIGVGDVDNYFAYRMPQLKSYEASELFTEEQERGRFFTPYTLIDLPLPMDTAGHYITMGKNLLGNQVARFRHTVDLSSFAPEIGSLGLIHFKTEHAFEKFARDGIAPSSSEVWSIPLTDYSDIGNDLVETTNTFTDKGLIDMGASVEVTSPSNALVRYNLVSETVAPTNTIDVSVGTDPVGYSLSSKLSVIWVSGVPYISGEGEVEMTFTLTETSPAPFYFEEQSGKVVYFDSTFIPPVAVIAPALGSNLSLEEPTLGSILSTTDYIKLSGSYMTDGGTTFGQINNTFTVASLSDTTEDGIFPSFTESTEGAIVVLNAPFYHATRKPVMSYDVAEIQSGGVASTLLYLSAQIGNINCDYGNYRVDSIGGDIYEIPLGSGDGGNPSKPSNVILTARKDTQERFLDEAYRIRSNFDGFVFTHYGQAVDNSNLVGPGLPLGMYFYEDFVIRDTNGTEHFNAGWLSNGLHASALPEFEAQVKGIPTVTYGRSYSYGEVKLGRGMLSRPSKNYTTAANNFLVAEDSATWQPLCTNYSTLSYTLTDVSYVRAFDVAFSRSGTVEDVVNKTQFTLRVIGLDFSLFNAPSDRYNIYVKVPGLTAWLDIGRMNNTGPSKQSVSLDGAGCCVSYTEGYLKTEGVIYTDVLCDVGPYACLKENTEGEVPILVKVVMQQGLSSAYINFMGDSYDARRGLLGLEVLRASNNKNFDEDGVV